jgi:hypothetical protein
MRVALIVVAIAFVASPSHASPSCMTMAEARAAFAGKHLWWHGPNRCWDATPGRRHFAQRIKARQTQKPASRPQAERAAVEEKKPQNWTHESQNWTQESRWRQAMSRMRAEDDAALQSSAPARASVDIGEPPATPRANWRDRWVEFVPRGPPAAGMSASIELSTAAASEIEPLVTPFRVILALLGVILTIAVVEIVFRSTIREWRS